MLAEQHRAFTPSRRSKIQHELVHLTPRGQQPRAGLGLILALTQFVHQSGDGGVLKVFSGLLQGPSADNRDAGLDGISKKRLTTPFVERRRKHRDFVQPQEQCVVAMVCRKVHAGDCQRIGQGRAPAVGSERRNGHCPAAQDAGSQDITKHERRRNPPVNIERVRDAEIVGAAEMMLAQDDSTADVRQPLVTQGLDDLRHHVDFVRRDHDVDVAVWTQRARRIKNMSKMRTLDDHRLDAGRRKRIQHAPQLARPHGGDRFVPGDDVGPSGRVRQQGFDTVATRDIGGRSIEAGLTAQRRLEGGRAGHDRAQTNQAWLLARRPVTRTGVNSRRSIRKRAATSRSTSRQSNPLWP